MADYNNKPLDGAGLAIVTSVINDWLNSKLNVNDISDWAKASTKPSYSATEVGAIPSSMSDTFAKKTDIASMYKYKGNVSTYANLPTDAEVGDTYNIQTGSDAGMNYAWNGTEWDSLGASFQLDPLTESEIKSIMGVT